MKNKLSIVFAGTPDFGLPCLEGLYRSKHLLKAVYTQPDRPAGRGRHMQPSAVKQWALDHGLPVYQPVHFKEPESIAELEALQPDVLVVIAYGLILPKKVLVIPKLGCINVHGSLLPRWRGASPIQQAILHGDKESGVTIMQMNEGMDTGDILKTVALTLAPEETAGSLYDKLAQAAATPLLSVLNSLLDASVSPMPQDNSSATYAGKIAKTDAYIDWHLGAQAIVQRIRAFHPWPVAYTCKGEEIIRIHEACVLDDTVRKPPGSILKIDKQGLQVAAGEGSVLIKRIQLAGGKVISIADYLNSNRCNLCVDLVLQ